MKRSKKIAAGAIAASLAFSAAAMAGCSSFDPDENENVDVYGPPIDEGFDPDDNAPETVYGPPEELGLEVDEDFNADENVTAGVYGPPQDVSGGLGDEQ